VKSVSSTGASRSNLSHPRRGYPLLTHITSSQNAFRQNILQMHESAQASLFSTVASRQSVAYTLTEDPNAPILQNAAPEPKSFKQRHPMGEESGSFEASIENEQLVVRTPYMHNKF
jgi:hypothetical protein